MRLSVLVMLVMLGLPWRAFAQTRPSIQLSTDVEDGNKMIHAVVTSGGKPLENVTLDYFVQRTFGNLVLGEDTTLDDGTSAVAFPSDLRAALDGMLHVTVRVKSPAKMAGISASAAFAADTPHAPISDQFPRALWAPQAPVALVASILGILGCVWVSYLFVVCQIVAIRKVGKT